MDVLGREQVRPLIVAVALVDGGGFIYEIPTIRALLLLHCV